MSASGVGSGSSGQIPLGPKQDQVPLGPKQDIDRSAAPPDKIKRSDIPATSSPSATISADLAKEMASKVQATDQTKEMASKVQAADLAKEMASQVQANAEEEYDEHAFDDTDEPDTSVPAVAQLVEKTAKAEFLPSVEDAARRLKDKSDAFIICRGDNANQFVLKVKTPYGMDKSYAGEKTASGYNFTVGEERIKPDNPFSFAPPQYKPRIVSIVAKDLDEVAKALTEKFKEISKIDDDISPLGTQLKIDRNDPNDPKTIQFYHNISPQEGVDKLKNQAPGQYLLCNGSAKNEFVLFKKIGGKSDTYPPEDSRSLGIYKYQIKEEGGVYKTELGWNKIEDKDLASLMAKVQQHWPESTPFKG